MTKVNLNSQKPLHLQNHKLSPVECLPLRSLFQENLGIIGRVIAGTLLFLPFWLIFGVCIIVGNGIGSFVAMFRSSRIPQPETSDLLSALDALWVLQPASKSPKQIAHVVIRLGEGMTMKDFLDILTNRLLNVKNPRGNPPYIYMRFRQRVYLVPGTSRHVFAFSPRFDIANHIRQIPEEVDNMDKFMDWASTISANNLEVEKPLWEMYVRTEFGPDNSSILLFRFHHCITDGQSMIQALFRDVLDTGEQIYAHMKPRFGGLTYASHFCQAVLMSGYFFFTDLINSGGQDLNVFKYPGMKLTGKYEVFWSEPVNLSVIQRLKIITRCRFNDLILTALAATLRTYCKMHGISTPADITACLPVDLRSAKGENLSELRMGNRAVMEKIKLPVSQEAGMPQLWRVRDQTHRLRHSYRHVALDFLIKILGMALSHRSVQSTINRYYSGCSLIVNSLHGPEGHVTIQKFKVEQMMMWEAPPFEMRIPLSVNVITNSDNIYLVIVADTGVIKDGFWLAMDFPHEVLALGNLLKTRHTPEGASGAPKTPGVVGEDDALNLDTEQVVQASLHVLEERLIKVQVKLRQMQMYRNDIGKVPALWKSFNLVLPSDNLDSDTEEEEVNEKSSSYETGDTTVSNDESSDEDDDSEEDGSADDEEETDDCEDETEENSNETSEERPSILKAQSDLDSRPATPDPSARKPATVTQPENINEPKTGGQMTSVGDKVRERRMSSKPLLFSPRSSLPDPTALNAEAPVRIPGRALRGRGPRKLSLNRGPGRPLIDEPMPQSRLPRTSPNA